MAKTFLTLPDGSSGTHSELERKFGLPYGTIYYRMHSGHKSGMDLVAPLGPKGQRPRFRDENGKSLSELSTETGLPVELLRQRWHYGHRGDALIRPISLVSSAAIRVEHEGKMVTLYELAKAVWPEHDSAATTLRTRYAKGLRGADLLAPINFRTFKREAYRGGF